MLDRRPGRPPREGGKRHADAAWHAPPHRRRRGGAATLHSREAESAERSVATFDLPRGACNCHVHIFADPAAFPRTLQKKVEKVFALLPPLLFLRAAWLSVSLAEGDGAEPQGARVS
jgi:hypothetical protein